MFNRRIAGGVAICAMAVALAFACSLPGAQTGSSSQASLSNSAKPYDATEWIYWGGDAGQTRYAPLNQINLQTVSRLKVAWRWTADTSGDPGSANYKSTPLLDDGVLQPSSAYAGGPRYFGEVWELTASPMTPYPGHRTRHPVRLGGFVMGAFVARGGSCLTPRAATRATRRKAVGPGDRRPCQGLRLAEDAD